MRSVCTAAAFVLGLMAAQAATASSVIALPPSLGTVGAATLTFGDDTAGAPGAPAQSKAWVLDQAADDGARSYLLQYNRRGGVVGPDQVQGAFEFSPLAGDTLGVPPRVHADGASTSPAFGDRLAITLETPGRYTLAYDLPKAGPSGDPAGFAAAHLLGPAFWGLMIAGFSLIGLGLGGRAVRARA
ncbi:hypothetical protein [Phenylobacterium sp.]|uniref:hypothetical protein n=1 Tax=Phenylobacterium sp. TaxID=1871053 RepID=UPI00286CD509|nr:hypothetical protein [Phenylobacterium sp.]